MNSAQKEEILGPKAGALHPRRDRISRRGRNLKLDWPLCLLPHDGRAWRHIAAVAGVTHPHSHEVAAAQLAVDPQIEKCKVPGSVLELQPSSDSPDFSRLEWRLLADQLSFVPRFASAWR